MITETVEPSVTTLETQREPKNTTLTDLRTRDTHTTLDTEGLFSLVVTFVLFPTKKLQVILQYSFTRKKEIQRNSPVN